MRAGAYRLSQRQIPHLVGDLVGRTISPGMISQGEPPSAATREAPSHERATAVPQAEAVNLDETAWRADRKGAWRGVTGTAGATVFTRARRRGGTVAATLRGSRPDQVVGRDRFGASEGIAAFWRPIGGGHRRRDFQALIDRGGDGAVVGRRWLALSHRLVRPWHRVRDGTLDGGAFPERMRRLRREVKQALGEGSRCAGAPTAATCFEILKVEEGLGTFARVEGVEPTNNAAERALRHAVIWRRISGGTDSERGSRFVERMRSGVATCRQQGRHVLASLTACFEADRRGQELPSLVPVTAPEIKVA
jgi:transposase